MPPKELIMYSRSFGCPYVFIAKGVLDNHNIPYKEIMIDDDETAMGNVLRWTGFLSVPTLVVAREGEILPHEPPAPLPHGSSPRGVNRGSMLTEPNQHQLVVWLEEHGFISATQ